MTTTKSYRSPKTEVKESSMIQGKGLFAKEFIKKGEIIAIKSGHITNLQKFNELDKTCKQYCLQIESCFFLGPKTIEEIKDNAIFINHSCEPNIGFNGQITYVALRDINAGEELTHDYAMCFTNMDTFSNLKCNCGSKLCRGKITGDDWKLKQLQDSYGNHFAFFILRKIYPVNET